MKKSSLRIALEQNGYKHQNQIHRAAKSGKNTVQNMMSIGFFSSVRYDHKRKVQEQWQKQTKKHK
jgi:hypothetical protein